MQKLNHCGLGVHEFGPSKEVSRKRGLHSNNSRDNRDFIQGRSRFLSSQGLSPP